LLSGQCLELRLALPGDRNALHTRTLAHRRTGPLDSSAVALAPQADC
jgi:hypothetical protein